MFGGGSAVWMFGGGERCLDVWQGGALSGCLAGGSAVWMFGGGSAVWREATDSANFCAADLMFILMFILDPENTCK